MSLEDKIKNAKESTWLTDGLTKKEVEEIVSEAKKEARKVDLIIELEKLKREFEDRILLNQTVAIQIIDKEIAELKGEQDNG